MRETININQKINYQIIKQWPTDEIVKLYQSANWWKESDDARAAIAPIIAGSFCFMVVTIEEKTVAMGRVISDGVSDGYIQDLVVLKDYRGLGIGKNLTKKLTQYCQEKGLVWIGLIAEPGTTAFYENIGYKTMKDFIPMRFPTKEIP